MANQIEAVNTIAITSIEAINTITDANLQALNTLEFTGVVTYNGITWTTDDVVPVGSNKGLLCGKVDSALYVNADSTSPGSYEHNGSSWSSVTTTGGAKHHAGNSGGTQNAAIIYGGYNGSTDGDTTDVYNGTSWSTVNSMTTGSAYATGGGEVQDSCFLTGGSQYGPDVDGVTVTQTFNGTTWTDESTPSGGQGSGVGQNSGGGGLDACLTAAGHVWSHPTHGTGIYDACYIFNKTASTWSGAASVSEQTVYAAGSSDGTRVYMIGGYVGGSYDGDHIKDTVQSYVSNAWTTENSLPVKTMEGGWGCGGQQATGGAFQAGGSYWNGSSVVSDSTQYHTAANTV